MLIGVLASPGMVQAQDNRLAARIAVLEAEVARLSRALEAAEARAAPASLPAPAPAPVQALVAGAAQSEPGAVAPAITSGPLPAPAAERFAQDRFAQDRFAQDRFALAALHLQASLAAGRPFPRELQALRDAAPPGGLPPVLADTLISHAGRGLPNAAELRERFLAIAPNLVERGAGSDGWLDWVWTGALRMLANLGLVEPPPQPAAQLTVTHVSHLLARGMIAPALEDLETLDAALLPLLSGWLAQARARVAAEQAVQETILRALNRTTSG